MSRCLTNITEELFQVFLVLKYILVEVGHFSDTDNLTALLEEDRDADILRKSHQCVQVAENLLVGALLVELFEVLPVALKRASFHTF